MATMMPRMSEKMNEWTIDSMQNSGETARAFRPDGLYDTNSNLRERGDEDRFTLEESIYQRAKIHPILTGALALGGGIAAAALISSLKSKGEVETGLSGFRRSKAPSLDIRENMEVVGADGQHVGTVDRVEYGEIKLTRKDSPDGKHHLISTELIESIAGGKVILTQPAEQIRHLWVTVEGKKEGGDAKDFENRDNSGFAAGAR
jgi:hypothetical protein